MKRFHVHLHVEDLDNSIAFYSRLFAAPPTRQEADYAKWMLEDPRLNFAISTRGSQPGVDHLGLQADDAGELAELRERAAQADLALLDAGETACCYARSDKYLITDPQGIAWEHFRTLGDIPVYGQAEPGAANGGAEGDAGESTEEGAEESAGTGGACCAGSAARGRPVAVTKPPRSCC